MMKLLRIATMASDNAKWLGLNFFTATRRYPNAEQWGLRMPRDQMWRLIIDGTSSATN